MTCTVTVLQHFLLVGGAALIGCLFYFIGRSDGLSIGRQAGSEDAWTEAYKVIGNLRRQLAERRNRNGY